MGSVCGKGEKPEGQRRGLSPLKNLSNDRLSFRIKKEEEEVINKDTINKMECTLANLVDMSRKIFLKLDVA